MDPAESTPASDSVAIAFSVMGPAAFLYSMSLGP